MRTKFILTKLPAVAVALSSVTAAIALGSHSGQPGQGGGGTLPAGSLKTYEYAYYCVTTTNGVHDSGESFTTVSNNRVRSTALVLTTAANGNSVPSAELLDAATPQFVSLDVDAKGSDDNTAVNLVVSGNGGFLNAVIWQLDKKQATNPLSTTPTGFTHYRCLISNIDIGPLSPPYDATSHFNQAAAVQFPDSNSSHTIAFANFALNSALGAPNVTVVTAPSVEVCEYIQFP